MRKKGFQLNKDKCEFSVTKVKYLKLIVITESIRIDLEKVQAIINWESLILIKNVQTFLKFAGFY